MARNGLIVAYKVTTALLALFSAICTIFIIVIIYSDFQQLEFCLYPEPAEGIKITVQSNYPCYIDWEQFFQVLILYTSCTFAIVMGPLLVLRRFLQAKLGYRTPQKNKATFFPLVIVTSAFFMWFMDFAVIDGKAVWAMGLGAGAILVSVYYFYVGLFQIGKTMAGNRLKNLLPWIFIIVLSGAVAWNLGWDQFFQNYRDYCLIVNPAEFHHFLINENGACRIRWLPAIGYPLFIYLTVFLPLLFIFRIGKKLGCYLLRRYNKNP